MSYRGGNRGANRGTWRGRGGNRNGGQSNGHSNGPPVKKFRAEDDFDDMDIDMEEFEDIEMNGAGGQEIPLELEETIESQEERFAKWRRPDPPKIDVTKDDLVFQQIDIDFYIGKHFPNMPGMKFEKHSNYFICSFNSSFLHETI